MVERTQKGNAQRKQFRDSKLAWVPINLMQVSENAQRRYRPDHAEQMAADFDLEAMGYPVVSRRDGIYYIIDGQHRVAALEIVGLGNELLQVELYEGMTEQDEARLFRARGRRKSTTPQDDFRIAVFGEEEPQTTIARIVERQGLKVGVGGNHNTIQAVQALVTVYNDIGGSKLGRSLMLLKESFDGQPSGFTSSFIRAMALVVHRYGAHLDDARIVGELVKVKHGTDGVRQKANVLQKRLGHGITACIAAAMVDLYNDGLRGSARLESWWQ